MMGPVSTVSNTCFCGIMGYIECHWQSSAGPSTPTPDWTVNTHRTSRRHHDNTYQKQSERGHEAFLGEFPRATVVFLIDLLEAAEVHVQHAGVDDAESAVRKTRQGYSGPGRRDGVCLEGAGHSHGDSQEAFQRCHSPDHTQDDCNDLPQPVDHIQELILQKSEEESHNVRLSGCRDCVYKLAKSSNSFSLNCVDFSLFCFHL